MQNEVSINLLNSKLYSGKYIYVKIIENNDKKFKIL